MITNLGNCQKKWQNIFLKIALVHLSLQIYNIFLYKFPARVLSVTVFFEITGDSYILFGSKQQWPVLCTCRCDNELDHGHKALTVTKSANCKSV